MMMMMMMMMMMHNEALDVASTVAIRAALLTATVRKIAGLGSSVSTDLMAEKIDPTSSGWFTRGYGRIS